MKGQIDTVEDDFWTVHRELFTAQFPSYYTKPQKVRGRFHTSEEKYRSFSDEIIPISEKHGKRTYVMMQPYVLDRFRLHPLPEDKNMQKLWKGFEHWLISQFPQATTLATPFNDPIAESIEEYQSFLKALGFSPLAETAYGKKIQ